MTVIYMDEHMKLTPPTNKDQVNDTERWCPGVSVGHVIDSPLNPILFSNTPM